MSKVYRKIRNKTIRVETPNDARRNSCNHLSSSDSLPTGGDWACCNKRGLDILARLVKVEVLKTVGTAIEAKRILNRRYSNRND